MLDASSLCIMKWGFVFDRSFFDCCIMCGVFSSNLVLDFFIMHYEMGIYVLHCVVLILFNLTSGLHKIQVSEWGQILADAKSDTDNSKRLDEIFIQVFLCYHARLSNSYGGYLYC